jgi:glycoside/pentoside/hexuronide:cation symporter, GPH family
MAPSNAAPEPSPKTLDPGDRVPLIQKLAIGVGEAASIGRQSIDHLALPVYNIMLGVSPLLVTTVVSAMRFIDALTDPLAGSLSDNSRSRFGRRKPFLVAGALACAITLPIVWWVPTGLSEHGYFLYFLCSLGAFYISYSFYDVPLIGLALEATPDYHERTRVAAYKAFFAHGSGVVTAWLFALTQAKIFHSSLHGVRIVGIGMGLLVLIIGMIPVLTVREGYRKISVTKKRMPFFRGLRETFVSKPFLLLCVIATGNKLSGQLVQSLGLYLIIYYVYHGDTKAGAVLAGIWGSIYQGTTVASIPVITWISTRFGKLTALRICLWTLILGSLSKWFTFQPGLPYLTLVTAVLLGPGQTAFSVILRGMIGDVCDEDELRTGLRREGMYGSMHRWIEKAMGSLAIVITGIVLAVAHFHRDAPEQPSSTLLILRVAYIAVPIVAVIAALIAVKYFPLTPERAAAIRAQLEARRGKPHSGEAPPTVAPSPAVP